METNKPKVKILNRELSWLDFNGRVLQEAQDTTVPLLQRLRFLGIFSNNQDEFIKVRVANLIRISRLKKDKDFLLTGGYEAKDLLDEVNKRIDQYQEIYTNTYEDLLIHMEKHGIYVVNETQITDNQKKFCRDYFSSEISQWLVPVMIRKTKDMPFLSDNVIYHAVKMASTNRLSTKYAIIQIPVNKTCPRFVQLPSEKGKFDVIFIDDIIRLCLDEIFFMFKYNLISAYSFTILRDSEITIDDDISKSLMEKIELGLEGRYRSEIVRLNYDKDMPQDILEIITSKLKLKPQQIIGGERYHKMRDLMKFPEVRPDLENINPAPLRHPDIKQFSSILEVIRGKDIFLNYPYHTFNHVVDFLREVAIDSKVRKIYITLYRTAERSKVINALINAVKNGKEVIVLEELMARFDEEQNVENSDLLQKSGVKVIHGFKGLKVHSKVILVERKEKQGNRGYIYVGTGNFNESTARIYGDFGLFTASQDVAQDARAFFDFLVNSHKHYTYKSLLVSPYFMRKKFESFIEREIKNKQKGKKAYIYAKFNSLTDVKMVKLLYKASQAGVEIRLIIRGACCLQPEVKGMSDNIKIISIVDKYLEHARMAIFGNDGDEQIFIQSADWMTRNLDNRVEVGIPILNKEIKKTLKDIFNIQWSDNVKARTLKEPGMNTYVKKNKAESCRSQTALYEYYKKMI